LSETASRSGRAWSLDAEVDATVVVPGLDRLEQPFEFQGGQPGHESDTLGQVFVSLRDSRESAHWI